jgi:hypothetical protein
MTRGAALRTAMFLFLVRSYFPEVSFRLIGMKLIVGERAEMARLFRNLEGRIT